jgi:probable lipoprotein NlpC
MVSLRGRKNNNPYCPRNSPCLFRLFVVFSVFCFSPVLFAVPPLLTLFPAGAGSYEARLKLIDAAEKYQGAPYRYGGIDSGGFDCSGLVFRSFQDAMSVSTPRTTTGLYSWAEQIPPENVQVGDLLFFKTTGNAVSHVGIYAGEGRFIHSASAGPRTGVMYSELEERYWKRTFFSVGRVLPESTLYTTENAVLAAEGTAAELPAGSRSAGNRGEAALSRIPAPGSGNGKRSPEKQAGQPDKAQGRYFIGLALASSWSGFQEDTIPFRGGAMQLRAAAMTHAFSRPILLGLELRPEWDAALGIFHLPVTLSFGFNDIFRIFAGPAYTAGDPVLKTSDGDRRYTGGNGWSAAVGLSLAPFSVAISRGTLSLYGEFAWQSFFKEDNEIPNLNADMSAGFRLSTGLRYTWKL